MSDLSKMVRDGSRSFDQVFSGDQRFRPIIIKDVTARRSAEVAAAVGVALDSARDGARGSRDRMVKAETNVAHQGSEVHPPIMARDQSTVENMDQHGILRGLMEAACPPEVVHRYKLTGSLPRNHDAVSQLSQHILATYDAEGAPPTNVAVDLVAVFEKLRPAAERLQESLAQVDKEKRDVQVATQEKHAAMAEFNSDFREYAGLVSLYLEQAGEDELARRLRPSRNRPGQTTDVAGGGTGEVPETDAA